MKQRSRKLPHDFFIGEGLDEHYDTEEIGWVGKYYFLEDQEACLFELYSDRDKGDMRFGLDGRPLDFILWPRPRLQIVSTTPRWRLEINKLS